MVYEFGEFQLDLTRQLLSHHGEPVVLAPKVFETLLVLVQNSGRTLGKEELIQALWPETFVEEGNLSQNIFLLRKALRDDRNGHSFIHTVPRKGYRFIAPVTEIEAPTSAADPRMANFWRRHSPFRSLQVFEPEDAWLFFGRDAETQEFMCRLRRAPVLVMIGNSGSGKSSLLRAGLIPALRAGRFPSECELSESWRIALFRPSAAPFDYLAEVLPSQLAPELSATEKAEFIADCRSNLRSGDEDALRNAVSALVLAASSATDRALAARVLLVVDQFEEIFTLTACPAVRNRYIEGLMAAARQNGAGAVSVHLVLSLRADFYAHCLDHARLSRCLETNLYNLPRMAPEQMRQTIENRLRLVEGRAESGLIDSLLEDVGAEPGNLALLEHALGQLWDRCGGPGCTFTNQAYAEIGRLRGALGRHADAVYQGLADDEEKHLAQKIFLELVHLGEGAQDTRRRVAKADLLRLGDPEQVERLLARLASSRLIATGREGDETFVEVSHEALIREWPALREWLARNREELALARRLLHAAEEWQSLHRDQGALLQGARLAQAEDWLRGNSVAPDLARQFVRASLDARTEAARKEKEAQERELSRQRTTAQRFRWFSYALAALLLVAAASAWYAYHQRVLERSRAMAARAEELALRDPGQALDLAFQSWRLAKTDEAHFAVAKAFPNLLFTMSHDDTVNRTAFSPDGQRILSVSLDHTAKLWSAKDGRLLAVLRHDGPVEHAEFSPDGERVVTASDDRTARLWSVSDGRLLQVFKGHTDKVWRAEFSPDGKRVATASLDRTARVWDCANGHAVFTLAGHTHFVGRAKFSPDGQRLVTISNDKTARVWSSSDGRLLAVLHHTEMVMYAEFSPDDSRIITAGYEGTARVWNAADGRLLATLKHEGAVTRAVFSPDGRSIATASIDYTARIWDSRDGRLLATMKHDGPVQHVEFSADGRRIATASFDRTARIWSSNNGRLLAVLSGHSREVYHAAFSPSGEQVVTGSADHTVRVWNLLAGWSATVLHHNPMVARAVFSPDGRLVAAPGSDHMSRVWSASDGRLLCTLQGHSGGVWGVAFSPDGLRIATASEDHTARVWNSTDGRLLAVLQGHKDAVYGAQFSPDSERVVTISKDHTARLWNSTDGRLLAVLQGHSLYVIAAQFSPDGQRIVTGSWDHTARIWNSTDGRLLAVLQGHTDAVLGAQFSPDSERVVTISKDHTARLWNSTDGRLLAVLQGHTDAVWGAQFSPDGQRIVTPSWDHTARVWDGTDGRLLAVLRGHPQEVFQARFSPDGQRIVTVGNDTIARVWNSSDGSLVVSLHGHAGMISAVSFSSDGQRILTASGDQSVRIWQILTLDDIERILSK